MNKVEKTEFSKRNRFEFNEDRHCLLDLFQFPWIQFEIMHICFPPSNEVLFWHFINRHSIIIRLI